MDPAGPEEFDKWKFNRLLEFLGPVPADQRPLYQLLQSIPIKKEKIMSSLTDNDDVTTEMHKDLSQRLRSCYEKEKCLQQDLEELRLAVQRLETLIRPFDELYGRDDKLHGMVEVPKAAPVDSLAKHVSPYNAEARV